MKIKTFSVSESWVFCPVRLREARAQICTPGCWSGLCWSHLWLSAIWAMPTWFLDHLWLLGVSNAVLTSTSVQVPLEDLACYPLLAATHDSEHAPRDENPSGSDRFVWYDASTLQIKDTTDPIAKCRNRARKISWEACSPATQQPLLCFPIVTRYHVYRRYWDSQPGSFAFACRLRTQGVRSRKHAIACSSYRDIVLKKSGQMVC
jgi:hypothetical protein